MTVAPLFLAFLTLAPTHVDLRPAFDQWQLPPRAQGSRGTCSVFTVTAALEYASACRTGQGVPFSVEYLNWAAHAVIGKPGDGSFFWMATDGFQKYGICPDLLMPYQKSYDPQRQPSDEATQAAQAQLDAPLTVHWIKQNGSPRGLNDDEVAEIKAALRAGWPVCAGAAHSVLYVGYHEDPEFPGWSYFITRDSALNRYSVVSERTAREIVCDALWIEAPGATPPAPSTVDLDSAPAPGPEPSLRGNGLAIGWSVQVANDSLSALAFSPDGRMLAAAWRHPCDSRLYHAADGTFLGTLGSDVMSVAFAADGQRVLAGSRKVARWAAVADGHSLGKLEGHTDWIEAAACPVNGDWLATGSGDRTVWLWSVDGTTTKVLTGATGPISQVWIAPDGSKVAASSWDHIVRVWSVASGTLIRELPRTDVVAFLSDRSGLAIGRDGLVEFERIEGGASESLPCPGRVTALACSPDGRLAIGNDAGRLALMAADGTVLGEVSLGARVTRLVFSADGWRLAAGTDAGRISVWATKRQP